MRKLLILCLICVLMVSGCGVDVNTVALQNAYSVDNQTDYIIDESSGLGLKLFEYKYNNKSEYAYVLAYLYDENIEEDFENGFVKSLCIGENCISLTSTVLDIGRGLNSNILLDLVDRLNKEISMEDTERVIENLESSSPYIISKNDTFIFIDYITTIPNVRDRVIYYRILIEDVSNLDVELTEEEISVLPNNLPKLLEVLKITEEVNVPK